MKDAPALLKTLAIVIAATLVTVASLDYLSLQFEKHKPKKEKVSYYVMCEELGNEKINIGNEWFIANAGSTLRFKTKDGYIGYLYNMKNCIILPNIENKV